ncbi:MAG: hypothetical protein ACOX52_05105 [Verrucomicrobiota bacterium]
MRARPQPEQESIPIPIPIPTPILTMFGPSGNPSYTYSPHHRVRVRVPLRCVRVRFWAELEPVRKAHWGIAEGSAAPDGEDSRRDRRGRRGVLGGGKRNLHRSRFQQLPWSTESVSLKITPKK